MCIKVQVVSQIGLDAEAVAVAVVQGESVGLVGVHRNLCQHAVDVVVAMTSTGEVRTSVARIGVSALALEVEFVLVGVDEEHVDESGGLDAVEAVACTVAILLL